MSQKYDRKSLAFFLADLGEELERPPRPSDLKKGMPSRSTFARYFKDWDEALEYAGYTKDCIQDMPVIIDRQIKIINLLGKPAIVHGPDGVEIFESSGHAKMFWAKTKVPNIAKELSPYLAGQTITTPQFKFIGVEMPDGSRRCFPSYEDGTYYIVPEYIIEDVAHFRTNIDLLYPNHRSTRYDNDKKVFQISLLQTACTEDSIIE